MPHSHEKILQRWFTSCLGGALLTIEKSWLAKHLPLITGNVALQMGITLDWLEASPIRRRFIFYGEGAILGPEEGVQVDFYALPLLPSSVDFVLAVHVLEGLTDPRRVLAEIYQALAPDGKLVLFSLNPYSLWGLQRMLHSKGYQLPQGLEYCSSSQIRHWLLACGYRLIYTENLFFRPMVDNEATLSQLLWMEAVGPFLYPGFGAVSVFLVEKYEMGMTPLKVLEWIKRMGAKQHCLEPTARIKS